MLRGRASNRNGIPNRRANDVRERAEFSGR